MDSINHRWQDYCHVMSEAARRFCQSSTGPSDQITDALNQFINADPPQSEAELGIRMGQGDQLQNEWQMAYEESENHEPIPMPKQSIAEQAEQARQSKPQ